MKVYSKKEKYKNKIDPSNKFVVSLDVASLYTNIPLKESIDLAISYTTKGDTSL